MRACAGQVLDGVQAGGERLRVNRFFPVVLVDVERVAELSLDTFALFARSIGMVDEPVLGAQGLQHVLDGQRAVLERNTREFRSGALAARCAAGDADDRRRAR